MRLDTKEKRLQARDAEIKYLKEEREATVQNIYDLIIVRYMNARPCVKIYKGSSYHPIAFYSYRTEEQREKSIEGYISSSKSRISYKAERQRKRKEFQPTIKADDILYDSWGYDQTNIDFYLVLSVKGMFATVREICCKGVPGTEGFMCQNVLPDKEHFTGDSKPMKKRICEGDCIRTADYGRWAHKWQGQALYNSWYA